MFDIFGKYKNVAIGIILVIIVIVIIYLYGQHQGKLKANGPTVVYPDKGNGIPAGWDPTPLAKELFDVMDGVFTMATTKNDTLKKYLSLPTDDMFVSVYSAFNQLYYSKGDGTLRQWINDEVKVPIISYTVEALNVRFDKLNLS